MWYKFSKRKEYLELEDARRFVNKLGLKNLEEWKQYTQSPDFPDFIPKNPHAVYSYTDRYWRGIGEVWEIL